MLNYELKKCDLCGEEWPDYSMHEVNTGRVRHICPRCYETGQSECYKHKTAFFKTDAGKRILRDAERKRKR